MFDASMVTHGEWMWWRSGAFCSIHNCFGIVFAGMYCDCNYKQRHILMLRNPLRCESAACPSVLTIKDWGGTLR